MTAVNGIKNLFLRPSLIVPSFIRKAGPQEVVRGLLLGLLLLVWSPPHLNSEESGSNKEETPPVSGQFIKLHPMMIPVVQNRQLIGAYSISLVVEATSLEAADALRKIQPTLRDALLTDIYGLFSLVWDAEKRVHLPDFKARLLRVAQAAVGKERVKEVLIQSFQRQISKRHRGYDYRK